MMVLASGVAGAVDVAGPEQREVFHVRREGMAEKSKDAVGTLTCKFRDFAAGLIDVVDVVARAAEQLSTPPLPTNISSPALPNSRSFCAEPVMNSSSASPRMKIRSVACHSVKLKLETSIDVSAPISMRNVSTPSVAGPKISGLNKPVLTWLAVKVAVFERSMRNSRYRRCLPHLRKSRSPRHVFCQNLHRHR